MIRLRIFLGICLSFMMISIPFGHLAATAHAVDVPTGGKLIYGLTLSPSGIDPHVNASSELGIVLSSVYDPLVWETPDKTFVAGLAESWEVTPDGKTYTFHLSHDVAFHDGSPLNAAAVKANFDRIADPATKSQKAAGMLGPFDRAEVVDEYTVALHLKEPFAPLLDSLSQVYIAMASPTALQKWGADYQMHQVGTGPFEFKEYVPGDHLTIVANPAYNWAPQSVVDHQGRAHLDEIEFRFFTEPATRALALQGGEAQVMGELPPLDAERLKSNPGFQLIPVSIPGQPLQFFINTQRPPTDDLNVRRALLYATDRATIVSTIFKGFSPIAYGPLSADTFGFDPALKSMYEFDPGKAAQLLDDAGWKMGQDGIREKNGQPLRLEAYLMTWGFVPEVGALLQAQLRAAGVDLQTQTVAFPAAVDAAQQGKHNLMPFTLSNTDPDLLRSFFTSQNLAGFNWSKVSDPELDQWLEQGATTLDPAKRVAIYAKVQERIMDQALILPIRDYVNINAASAKVKDLHFDVRGWFPLLYDAYLEP